MPAPTVTTEPATPGILSASLALTANPNALATTGYCELWDAGWESSGWPYRENPVINQDFENGLIGWTTSASSDVVDFAPSEAWVAVGNSSAHVEFEGKEGAGGTQAGVLRQSGIAPTDAGAACILQVRMNVLQIPSGKGLGPHVYVECIGTSGTFGISGTSDLGELSRTVQFVVPTGTTSLRISIGHTSIPGAGIIDNRLGQSEVSEFYVDAVLIEQTDDEAPDFFPTPAQLASGQAVFTGADHESSSRLATSTYVPASKDLDAGEGEDPVALSTTATGLTPSTTYNYRAVGENEDGEGSGEVEEFTTKARPVLDENATLELEPNNAKLELEANSGTLVLDG